MNLIFTAETLRAPRPAEKISIRILAAQDLGTIFNLPGGF
jgi:hypothetical protein